MDTFVLQPVHIMRTTSRIAVDKPKRPKMNQSLAIQGYPTAAAHVGYRIDRRIRAFIDGESHGEDVLSALYGDVADEPVPERLRALLKH
jgi:anti-sigma factor NepR-like protein